MSQDNPTNIKPSSKQLRNLGHSLKPSVTIASKGLTESVVKEVDRALADHELVKVKIAISDREQRKAVSQELCEQCSAALVQSIGKVLLIYKEAKKPKLKTSNTRGVSKAP